MDWITLINSLMTLQDIPDERIISLVPWGIRDAATLLGSELASSLEAASDPAWTDAVAHFIASRLILSSRPLIMQQGFPAADGTGLAWAKGEEKPAGIEPLLAVAARFKNTAVDICTSILKSLPDDGEEPRWYDV